MAKLYEQQGHLEEAIQIYLHLAQSNPNDVHVRTKLRQLGRPLNDDKEGEAMGFREHTQGAVEAVPGAISCAVLGYDGIVVDSFEREGSGVDTNTILAEYTAVSSQLKTAADGNTGGMTEFSVMGNSATVLLRPLSDEFLLAMVLGPKAIPGKARFVMRMTAPRLAGEF